MATPDTTIRIPEPRGLPLLGNVTEFKSTDSLQDLNRLHDTYGEIFRLKLPGGKTFVCTGSNRLVNELCDESRFKKSLKSEVGEARIATHDGLFTAENEEENWGIAHRILMPAFGPVAVRGMFDEMYDITTQMTLKWARHSSSQRIAVSEDFTRLALDTIALSSMDYRFNSYYKEGVHPFVQSMADALTEIGKRYQRPDWAKKFFLGSEHKLSEDIKAMRKTAAEIIKARRANPESNRKQDHLLAAMMDGVDPKTGKKLTDDCITDNLITFLVAGHETTSGTLSFAMYSLLKNPAAYQRAQKEVDEVIGRRGPVTVEKIYSLKYIPAVLRETLRQCAPIPAFNLEPLEDTTLAGKYPVKKGEAIVAYLTKAHRDPAVFGEDADEFKPERMMDDNFNRLQKEFPNCWKPFGNGMRGCIGRPFAWQEMLLALTILLQNLDFYMDDPSYSLKIVETLTIKPKDFYVRASLRHGMTAVDLERQLRGGTSQGENLLEKQSRSSTPNISGSTERPMSIFYGSNSGTCKALALRLATDAKSHGFKVAKVDVLDAARDNLPINQPVVILTSSYEGHPPDNAAHFVTWLKNLAGQEAQNVSYAVFGVGNREWSQTFHSIPKLVDKTLEERGAERVAGTGFTDVSDSDPFSDFENWEDEILWPALEQRYARSKPDDELTDTRLSVQVTMPRSTTLRQETREAIVTATRTLTAPGTTPVKKHIEIRLATGTVYRAGDYLAVLPLNPRHTVERVFRRFGLAWDAALIIKGDKLLPLPLDQPTSAWDIFTSYVELGQPATKRNILALAQCTQDLDEQKNLKDLSGKRFRDEIMKKRISILDLLEEFPLIELPIAQFLAFLPPMRIRQYSISSSPLKDPNLATLSYSLLDEPSLAGHGGRHVGVATNYLSSLNPSDRLQVAVRPSNLAFHLPPVPETTPIICIAAGAGIAPFRGFIQERAVQIAAGRILAPAILFYGCRGRADDLYREELDGWEVEGAVQVKRAFSRDITSADKETMGCKYVQHRMMLEKEFLYELWSQGAKLFVCGSREFGAAVERTCVELIEQWKEPGEDARELLEGFRNERFVMDVFD